jgi:DNA-binding MarR family transcriptional regulator
MIDYNQNYEMNEQNELTKSYLSLIEFLLLAKRNLIIVAEKLKITSVQALTLLLLDDIKPMHTFTKIFHCDASNTTGIIDGLEKKGLVKRYESPKDRRVKMVEITAEGSKIRKIIIDEQTKNDNYIQNKLTKPELATFVNLMQKISS